MSRLFTALLFSITVIWGQARFVHLTPDGYKNKRALLQKDFAQLAWPVSAQAVEAMRVSETHLRYRGDTPFDHWLIIERAPGGLINALDAAGWSDYSEQVGHFKVEPYSADSLSAQQWYLEKVNAPSAWQVTTGSPDVVVGIIDTGVDYEHPDVQDALWINIAEDINGNGRFDPGDINDKDDDGNGFVDDVIGWDFTDAPRFPDGGDYTTPDNRPMDEFSGGHGTEVAGLIAATANNGRGISGLAPGVRIMPLRAGTASGYLEEDDVARALFYALNNGARVVNMSFGDTALSRFLRDVIRYVSARGVICIASAGNSATDQIHFPSGLPEVISVGASTPQDGLAGFSNYGTSVDLLAPGTDLISTAPGGGYNTLNGTSFSAPLVSATAALIYSIHPTLTPEEIRHIITSASDDILFNGWDAYSGAGRLNAGKALRVPYAATLRIESPAINSAVAEDTIAITATILHPDLSSYVLSYGIGETPENWQDIVEVTGRQAWQDTIARLPAHTLADTTYGLRLRVQLQDGSLLERHGFFHLDRTAPVINRIAVTPLLDGRSEATLITFNTSDVAVGDVTLFHANGDSTRVTSPYESTIQRIKLDGTSYPGRYTFKVSAVNRAGLRARPVMGSDTLSMGDPYQWRAFESLQETLPAGYYLDHTLDLDRDGKPEVMLSRYDEENAFGPVEIYEFENGQFELRLKTSFSAIPRDGGDVDGDGRSDILLGYGRLSWIFEADTPGAFPSTLIWQDTSNYWGAGYADTDRDGRMEIIVRDGDAGYRLLESVGDNSFTESTFLENTSEGANRLGVPRVALADLDGDGRTEIIYGDYDGDVLVFGNTGDNAYKLKDVTHSRFPNATEMISADDSLLVVASHTSENVNYEHEFDARYWQVETFRMSGGKLTRTDTLALYGFSDTRDFDSGMTVRSLNGRATLFCAFFPRLYLFERVDNHWQAVWLSETARSNTVLISDLSGTGSEGFYFNTGKALVGYSAHAADRPATPAFVTLNMTDSAAVTLGWITMQADYFKIYRKMNNGEWTVTDSVTQPVFKDSLLQRDSLYQYAVTAVNRNRTIPESYYGLSDSLRIRAPLRIIRLRDVDQRSVRIEFDKPLRTQNAADFRVYLNSRAHSASSVVLSGHDNEILVTFEQSFSTEQPDTLLLEEFRAEDGMLLASRARRVVYQYRTPGRAPFVLSHSVDNRSVEIVFSGLMRGAELTDVSRYTVQPSGSVSEATLPEGDSTRVRLTLDARTFSGASGQASWIELNNLHDTQGRPIRENSKISLFQAVTSLDKLRVYPQPDKPENTTIYFSRLPAGEAQIVIYSLRGKVVRTLRETVNFGGVAWDKKDDNGAPVSAGVYLYILEIGGQRRSGKCVIMR